MFFHLDGRSLSEHTRHVQNTYPDRVAAEVRAEMARHRTVQTKLAEHLGYSRHALARRLFGHVPFDVAELEKIAEFLGVPLAQLMGFTSERAA